MNVRPANTEDYGHLFSIHELVFRSHIEKLWGWNEVWQRENFASDCVMAKTSVIEVDDQIAGYIQILDRGCQIYLQNIAIAPAFQNAGIGTGLLNDLQLRAATRGVPLHLGVFKTNMPAHRLYQRLGFRDVGETRTHIEMFWIAPCLESPNGTS